MLDAWGGKIADVDANAMAFLHRGKSQIGLQLYTKWEESDAATAVDRKSMVQTWRESMTPFVLPTAYQNYIDSTLPLESYYGVDGLKKLKEVKTRMDPYNLWKFAQASQLQ
ncbi:hypothetical protein BC829DRAFT_415143 [Chytridium lagenaria]|nr:hypothetical protein BC829DRAFT_415143 [Chytridium lagenaria]